MTNNQPAPDGVMRLIFGYWNTGVIGAAATHSVFTHLENGAGTAAEVAARAGISERGAQSLLDGLVSVELVVLQVVGLDSDEFRASADGLRRRRRRRRVHPAQWRCRKDAEEYQQSRGNGWMRSRACRRVPRRRHGQRQWQRRRGHLDDAGLHECSWTRMGARLGL
jgi:hypothetical protein